MKNPISYRSWIRQSGLPTSLRVTPLRDVNNVLLEHGIETRLNELADLVSSQIADFVTERRYREALQSFAALAPELETFFKDVMVMVDDPRVRANRKSLLMKTAQAIRPIADVTKIVVDRRDYRT